MQRALRNLAIIILFCFFPLISDAATTYYVRTDGSNSTNCLGTTDAAYPGSGTGQACAFNHPAWPIGTPAGAGAIMSGGDTLIIGPGQYDVGYGMQNGCSGGYDAFPYDAACMMNVPPDGTDSSHKTKIYGAGWDSGCASPPELWGNKSVKAVLNLSALDHFDFRCVDVTDHKACGYAVGATQCSTSYPLGSGDTYGRTGIIASSGSDWFWDHINVHGMGYEGGNIGDITDWETQYVKFVGNYFAGLDMDNRGIGGAGGNSGLHWHKNLEVAYNGFLEAYPASSTVTESDYSQAYDQNDTGYGDGFGTYYSDMDFTCDDCNIHHNVSDGIDLLYHNNNGTLRIHRGRYEGNNGNQIKTGLKFNYIENAKIVGNCGYIREHGFTHGPGFTFCRADGNPIAIAPILGQIVRLKGVTVWTDGATLIDRGKPGEANTCDGSEELTIDNTIMYGAFRQDGHGTQSSYYYCSGSNGDGAGSCCTGSPITPVLTNTIVYNAKETPAGTNVVYTDPHLAIGDHLDAEVDSTDYDFNLTAASTNAIDQASTSVTFDGTSNDNSNVARGSTWDIGAFEYNTSSNQIVVKTGAAIMKMGAGIIRM